MVGHRTSTSSSSFWQSIPEKQVIDCWTIGSTTIFRLQANHHVLEHCNITTRFGFLPLPTYYVLSIVESLTFIYLASQPPFGKLFNPLHYVRFKSDMLTHIWLVISRKADGNSRTEDYLSGMERRVRCRTSDF